MVECSVVSRKVAGSNPVYRPNLRKRMLEFDSLDKWSAKDAFTIFTVKNQKKCNDFYWLINTDVLIDGKKYHVRGVEYSFHKRPFKKGEKIGLFINSLVV